MKSNDYQNELAGFVALPNRMQYSLVEFARRIKHHLKVEQEKIAPDNSLINLLCNAAWLGWEQIEGFQASLDNLEAAISAYDNSKSNQLLCCRCGNDENIHHLCKKCYDVLFRLLKA